METERETNYKYAQDIEEELKEIGTKIDEYLDNYILEITREQYLSSEGKWETTHYTLLRTWGGPAVYIHTDGTIEVVSWNDKLTYRVDEEAKKVLENIEDYLRDIFPD